MFRTSVSIYQIPAEVSRLWDHTLRGWLPVGSTCLWGLPVKLTTVSVWTHPLPLPDQDSQRVYLSVSVWWESRSPALQPAQSPLLSAVCLRCARAQRLAPLLGYTSSLASPRPWLIWGGQRLGRIVSHHLHLCHLGGPSDKHALLTWLDLALFSIYSFV